MERMAFIKTYYKLLLWTIVIGVLCFTPGNDFKEVKINIPHFDKIVHFVMFYIMGLLIRVLGNFNEPIIKKLLLFAVVYGILIEIVQYYYIPMRSGEVFDFFSDFVGLVAGFLSINILPKTILKLLK